MSLTNDMLKNLEKRRSLNNDHTSLLDGLESTASRPSHFISAIYIFVILVFVGICVGIFYMPLHFFKLSAVPTKPIIIPPAPINTHLKFPPKKATPVISPKTQNTPIAPVKTQVQTSTQDQAIQLYQAALAYIAQNQISAAIEKLKNVIQLVPTYQDARVTLATLYLENNEAARAIQLLTDGLAIEPHHVPLTLLFARALMMQGNDRAALIALNDIADVASNNSDYTDLLAAVQESLGHYSEAISLYQALLHDNPTNTRWLISLGVALEKTGQKEDALRIYQKANTIGSLPPNLQNYVTDRIRDLGG